MKKFKEIGSNFWFDLEEIGKGEFYPPDIKYVKEVKDIVYTSSGRGAISLILGQLNPSNGCALLPLYTCESVIMPFLKKKYDVVFYDCYKNLSINIKDFIEAVNKYKPDVVLTHAYFGFDTIQDIRSEYQWLREQGIIVVEDITHSFFSHFVKEGADYYLASLRKWFGLPDGGVAITTDRKMIWNKVDIHEEVVKQNIKAAKMKKQYTKNLDPQLKEEYRRIFYFSEEILDNDCDFYEMSNQSKGIISNTDFNHLTENRRSNYTFLLKYLINNPAVTPIFKELPEEVVPLYLPVYVNGDRAKLQSYLAESEIYVPIHWLLTPDCDGHLTKTTSFIYNNILSIPCDQRYTHKDMKRIAERLLDYS